MKFIFALLAFALPVSAFIVRDEDGKVLSSGDTLSFGTLDLGGIKTRTLTVTNDAKGKSFSGLPVTIDGSQSRDFVLEAPASLDLPAGESATIRVIYMPEAEGQTSAATLHVWDFDLSLDATAGSATLPVRVEEVGGDVITALSAPIDFGTVRLGNASVKTFRVTNLGTAPLTGVYLSVDDPWMNPGWYWYSYPDYAGFNVSSGFPGTLAPGASADFQVQWWPQVKDAKSRHVLVQASNINGSAASIPVTGSGSDEVTGSWRLGGVRFRFDYGADVNGVLSYAWSDPMTDAERARWTYTPPPTPAPEAAVVSAASQSVTISSGRLVTSSVIAMPVLLRLNPAARYPFNGSLYLTSQPDYENQPHTFALAEGDAPRAATGSPQGARIASGGRFVSNSFRLPASDSAGMELWLRADTVTGTQQLAFLGDSADAGFGLHLVDDRVQASIGATHITGKTSIAPNEWHHVALIFKDGAATLLLDGVSDGEAAGASLPDLVKGLAVGADSAGSSAYSGVLDELRVFEIGADFDPATRLLLNAKPSASTTKTSISFANTMVGIASASQSIAITNSGAGALQVLNSEIIGDDAGDFHLSNGNWEPIDTPIDLLPANSVGYGPIVFVGNTMLPSTWLDPHFTVEPGYRRKLNVSFNPTGSGPRTATLRLTTNDAAHALIDIPLSGTGDEAAPRIALSMANWNWGSHHVDGPSWDYGATWLTITNTGSQPLTGVKVTSVGPSAADVTIAPNYNNGSSDPAVVPSYENFTLTVRPQAVGARYSRIRIESNDPTTPVIEIPVWGHGLSSAPDIAVTAQNTDPEWMAPRDVNTGDAVSFGSLFTTGRQSTVKVVAKNTNYGALHISQAFIDGPGADDFTLSVDTDYGQPLPASLEINYSTTLIVVFSPKNDGPRSAKLHIVSDDADEADFVLNLTGTGLDPAPVLVPGDGIGNAKGDLHGAFVRVGTAVVRGFRNEGYTLPTQPFVVQNVGVADLVGPKITFTGDAAGDFSASMSSVLVNGSGVIAVTFDPSAIGARSAMMHVQSGSAVFDIPVAGTGAFGEKASLNPHLPAGWVTTAMAEQPDGTIVVAGYTLVTAEAGAVGTIEEGPPPTTQQQESRIFSVSRAGDSSELHSVSPHPFKIIGAIRSIAIASDGLLIAGEFSAAMPSTSAALPYAVGNFDSAYSAGRQGIAKIDTQGIVTNAFKPPTGDFVGRAVVALPDGKVLVGGTGSLGGRKNLIRLNADGSLDSTFTLPEPDGAVNALALQDDGKVLVGGEFTNLGGAYVPGPYPREGTADATNNGFFGVLRWGYGPLNPGGLCRLNADGTLDSTFGNPGFNKVTALAVRGDRIAVGGEEQWQSFWVIPMAITPLPTASQPITGSSINNTVSASQSLTLNPWGPSYYQQHSARLLTLTGQTIASDLLENTPRAVALQSGDRMYVAPGSNYGTPRQRSGVMLIQPASESPDWWGAKIQQPAATTPGSIDLGSFTPGSLILAPIQSASYRVQEFDGDVNALLPQPDGKMLVGGGTTMACVIVIGDMPQPTGVLLPIPIATDPIPDETPVNGLIQLDSDGFFNRSVPLPGSDGLTKLTFDEANAFRSIGQVPSSLNLKWTIDGPDADAFQGVAYMSAQIPIIGGPPGGIDSVMGLSIAFTAKRGGVHRAVLHVTADGYTDAFDIGLEGFGATALPDGLKVLDPEGTRELASGDAIDFGTVAIGKNDWRTCPLINAGNAITNPLAFEISGANSADFTITSPPAYPIASGGGAKFTITFQPAAGALPTRTAELRIHDGSGRRPFVLQLSGMAEGAPVFAQQPQDALMLKGQTVAISAAAQSTLPITWQWFKNGKAIPGATNSTLVISNASAADVATYTARATNKAGSVTSSSMRTGVLDMAPTTLTAATGKALQLTCKATGAGPLSYRWSRSGSPLPNATTAKLSLPKLIASSAGDYVCTVSLGTVQMDAPPITVNVLLPPVISSGLGQTIWRVGQPVNDQIAAVSDRPAVIVVEGLPPGVTANMQTGIVSGTPTKAGTYRVRIQAWATRMGSAIMEQVIEVQPLPVAMTGSFTGLLDRGTNSLNYFGGTCFVTVSANGTYTMKMRVGQRGNAGGAPTGRTLEKIFTGRLTVSGDGSDLAVYNNVSPATPSGDAWNVGFASDGSRCDVAWVAGEPTGTGSGTITIGGASSTSAGVNLSSTIGATLNLTPSGSTSTITGGLTGGLVSTGTTVIALPSPKLHAASEVNGFVGGTLYPVMRSVPAAVLGKYQGSATCTNLTKPGSMSVNLATNGTAAWIIRMPAEAGGFAFSGSQPLTADGMLAIFGMHASRDGGEALYGNALLDAGPPPRIWNSFDQINFFAQSFSFDLAKSR